MIMQLTIAIPTYNRNEILKRNLATLLPQLTPDCELLIIDNHSDVPVQEGIGDLVAQYPSVQCRIVRNRFNIGGNANIMRCFELANAEWLWVLSDDDPPKREAVVNILDEVRQPSDAISINFANSRIPRLGGAVYAHTLDEVLATMNRVNSLLFISTNVYRREALMRFAKWGYHHCYSMSPHLAMLFLALLDGAGQLKYTDAEVISILPPAADCWPRTCFLLTFLTLCDLPMSRQSRRRLASRFFSRGLWDVTLSFIDASLTLSIPKEQILYQNAHASLRYLVTSGRWYEWFLLPFATLLVRYPRLGVAAWHTMRFMRAKRMIHREYRVGSPDRR